MRELFDIEAVLCFPVPCPAVKTGQKAINTTTYQLSQNADVLNHGDVAACPKKSRKRFSILGCFCILQTQDFTQDDQHTPK